MARFRLSGALPWTIRTRHFLPGGTACRAAGAVDAVGWWQHRGKPAARKPRGFRPLAGANFLRAPIRYLTAMTGGKSSAVQMNVHPRHREGLVIPAPMA